MGVLLSPRGELICAGVSVPVVACMVELLVTAGDGVLGADEDGA